MRLYTIELLFCLAYNILCVRLLDHSIITCSFTVQANPIGFGDQIHNINDDNNKSPDLQRSKERTLVSMRSQSFSNRPVGIKTIHMCIGCSRPEIDHNAIHLDSLVAARGPQNFNLRSKNIIYAIPNHGQRIDSRIMNSELMQNSVVIFDRGAGVSIVDKALLAQEFQAVGVIIIDDGRCDEEMTHCGMGASNITRGFGTRDHWALWSKVKIPCVLITEKRGAKLRNLLEIASVDIAGIGKQYIQLNNDDNINEIFDDAQPNDEL